MYTCIPHDYFQITLSLLSGHSIAMHADLHIQMLAFHSGPPLLCDYHPCKSCIEVRPWKKHKTFKATLAMTNIYEQPNYIISTYLRLPHA